MFLKVIFHRLVMAKHLRTWRRQSSRWSSVCYAMTSWRLPGEEVKYNEVALRVMREENIPVNDLHAVVLPDLSELQDSNDVHFNPKGSELLAKAVARSITEQLNHD